MMEKEPNAIGNLLESAGDYLETRLELLKLQTVSKSSEVTSSVVTSLVIVVLVSLAVFMLNVGLAVWIGEMLGKYHYGFFIVGGFYALLGLLLSINKKSWLKEPISNAIINKMLN